MRSAHPLLAVVASSLLLLALGCGPKPDEAAFQALSSSSAVHEYRAFLWQYPASPRAADARAELRRRMQASVTELAAVSRGGDPAARAMITQALEQLLAADTGVVRVEYAPVIDLAALPPGVAPPEAGVRALLDGQQAALTDALQLVCAMIARREFLSPDEPSESLNRSRETGPDGRPRFPDAVTWRIEYRISPSGATYTVTGSEGGAEQVAGLRVDWTLRARFRGQAADAYVATVSSVPGDQLRFSTAPGGRVGAAYDVMISSAFVGFARAVATKLGVDPAIVRDPYAPAAP